MEKIQVTMSYRHTLRYVIQPEVKETHFRVFQVAVAHLENKDLGPKAVPLLHLFLLKYII